MEGQKNRKRKEETDEREEERNVFIRRYWYGDSIKDIAKRFFISESKVKSVLFKTRNKLRAYLQQEVSYE